MKIFYEIPDSDNDRQNKILYLLFENYKLNMMWKLRKIEDLIKKENGSMFLDQVSGGESSNDMISLRLEGFSENLEIVIRGLLAGQELPA